MASNDPSAMQDFRNLEVWRKAHAMALNTHRLVGRLRGRDTISLRAQMLRAAMSVPANIVEGRAQTSDSQFARFLKIALGSAIELEYHLVLAADVKAISASDFPPFWRSHCMIACCRRRDCQAALNG